MDGLQFLSLIITLSVIAIITLIFLKFIVFGDLVERNLDKIMAFFIKK